MTTRRRKGSSKTRGITQQWCSVCRVWVHSDEPRYPHVCGAKVLV